MTKLHVVVFTKFVSWSLGAFKYFKINCVNIKYLMFFDYYFFVDQRSNLFSINPIHLKIACDYFIIFTFWFARSSRFDLCVQLIRYHEDVFFCVCPDKENKKKVDSIDTDWRIMNHIKRFNKLSISRGANSGTVIWISVPNCEFD